MPKTKISEFSATPGNNTDIDGINIAEGCAPSGINDAIRELMAQLKDFQAGTAGDSFNGPVGTTTAAAGAFTTLSATGATTLSSTLAFNNTASVPTATAFAFQPTSNAIAFGTANTERMRINSDGNVGIQNTGPSSYSAVNADNLVVGPNSGSNGITVVSGTTGTGNLAFADGAGTGGATDYAGLVQYDHNADNMNFFTGATERMRLNSSGLIAPAEVYRNSATSYVRLAGGDAAAAGAFVLAFGQSHATAPGRLSLGTSGTGTMNFDINSTEQMRLTSTGLGIGTSSPGAKLHVNGAFGTTATSAIRLTGTGQTTGDLAPISFYLQSSGWGTVHQATITAQQVSGSNGGANLLFGTSADGSAGPTTRMTLDSSGNLGIGTSSPAAKLHVSGGRTLAITGNESYSLGIGRESNTNAYYLGVHSTTNPNLLFSNNAGTTNLTLTYDGNLGLGVTPSAWASGWKALQFGTAGALVSEAASTTRLYNNSYYDGTSVKYINTGEASQYLQYQGQHRWYQAASGTAGNAITFTQAMTLDASGNLQLGATSGTGHRLNVVGTGGIRVNEDGSGTKVITIRSDFAGVGPAINVTTNDPLLLQTNNTERARITSGGDLLVGTSSGQVAATVVAYRSSAATACVGPWNAATSGDNLFVVFNTEATATQRGSIDYNRAGGLTRYNTTSDYRAKDIIGPTQNTGSTIDALKIYEGVMKGATQSRPMMIAHEAQAVVPFCVSGEKDEVNEDGTPKYQQMDHASLVPLLIAEIQSLRQRVAALEAK